MRIGIDVDSTVVSLMEDWLNWLNGMSGKAYSYDQVKRSYCMFDHFPEVEQPLKFWEMAGIYDNAEPFEDASLVIEALYRQGHEIVFISKVMGHHPESKTQFLERYFPFNSGIVYTSQKYLVDVDVMIDDRYEFLYPFPSKTKIFLLASDHEQGTDYWPVTHTWSEIFKELTGVEFNI